ncbi:hemolysin-III related-domain-containing protein [Mycotypha africana]|uniref:hemolysin-III related-domain-containing protein n=1 Tax=Mycotypha africana TaxID=64632 RepID=UPI002300A280|nr:hemolysin-III related-domain-containing protein [Mycotypha africana]KAI8991199.1 hemolysin-III related-domain-containing protein [Mycotypha africana]
MENLLTIQPKSVLRFDENVDLDDFFRDTLEPLMKKFRYRFSQFENRYVKSERFQNYKAEKIKKAHLLLEHLNIKWEERRQKTLEARRKVLQELDVKLPADQLQQQQQNSFKFITPPDLVNDLIELSKRYHELDESAFKNNGEMIDNTIDAFMLKMEELDKKISDALSVADKMRECVEGKISQVAGVANEHIDKLKYAMQHGSKRLLMYDELPEPWQSNQYIRTGYRFLDSAADCWYSLFYVHNESGNIWSHLLGFLTLFSIGIYSLFFSDVLTSIPIQDRLVFCVFFLAACKCLMCSTVWHTLNGINNLKTYQRVACLDYVGISVLICASIALCEYYGFYCDDRVRQIYMTATLGLAILGISMPFQSWFDRHELRWLRIGFFVALACSGAIIIVHLSIIRGAWVTFYWLAPVFKSCLCYIVGVSFYAKQFPESVWPGKFDHFGHSHQLWHIFVCGGIWYHYRAALQFASQRGVFGDCQLTY